MMRNYSCATAKARWNTSQKKTAYGCRMALLGHDFLLTRRLSNGPLPWGDPTSQFLKALSACFLLP
jgi:hypothetical protein